MSETLSTRLRAISQQTTMLRGNRGYGRKPSKGLIARLAQLGPVSVHHHDHETGETTIETVHDPNPIINDNKRQMLSGHDGYTPSRDFKKVATIPNGILDQWYKAGINYLRNEDWPKIAHMLDSQEWWFLRTAPGKVSKRPYREYLTRMVRR